MEKFAEVRSTYVSEEDAVDDWRYHPVRCVSATYVMGRSCPVRQFTSPYPEIPLFLSCSRQFGYVSASTIAWQILVALISPMVIT